MKPYNKLLLLSLPSLIIGCGSDSETIPIHPIEVPDLSTETLSLLAVDDLSFKDHNKNGELDAYEDWRLSPQERAEDLASQMTNAEKAGLMMHGTFVLNADSSRLVFEGDGVTNTTLIRDRFINTLITRQEGDAKLMAQDNNYAQRLGEETRLGIPISISSDPRNHFNAALGTSVSSGDFSKWTETLGLAAIGDAQFTKKFADVIRQEYLAVGINQALHPTADLATEPRWGRNNSTFGEDADLSRVMTKAYVQGLQYNDSELTKNGVWAVVKHFAGGGPQEHGTDAHHFVGRYQVYPANNFDYHRIPFKGAFEAGVAGVMPYYGIPDGQLPDNEGNIAFGYSKYIMTDILRGEEGFDGVLISDWLVANDCHGTCRTGIVTKEDQAKNPFMYLGMPWGLEDEDPVERFAASVDAGIDQFGGIDDPTNLLINMENGRLTEDRINLSVKRILTNKFKQGLFEDPYVDVNNVLNVVGKDDFQELANESQGRSVTLLKNEGNTLPISKGELGKVYVYANYGGTEQPNIVENAKAYGLNVVDSMEDADTIIIRTQTPAILATAWFPFGVMMPAGELGFIAQEDFKLRPYETAPDRDPSESAQICYEGLNDNLGACIYNGGSSYAAIMQAINSGKRVILDVFLLRPVALGNINDQIPVIVANYGTSDSIFFDVLTGKVQPEGKLPFGLPVSMDAVVEKGLEDAPSFQEDESTVLYPFGHGLTYETSEAINWQAKNYLDGDFNLPYQVYYPESEEKLPLVIHLHGSGEAGTDNEAQLYLDQQIGPDYFVSDNIQSIQKAVVLAPQTPMEMRWANTTLEPYEFSETPSTASMSALLKLIKEMKSDGNIDASRIYMTGLSRGGQGVWNAAMQEPNLFAAIVPIAGSGSPSDAGLINHLPIWAFHGDDDPVTDVNYTRDMIDALLQSGGSTKTIRYTEVEGGGHAESWLTAFKDEQLYEWLLSHSRN